MLAAGDLDLSFGTGGKVATDFGGHGPTWNHGRGIALQPDGKLVVAGSALASTGVSDFTVVRYTSGGGLDTGFGSGGTVSTGYGGGNAGANAVALNPSNGKIVVVGYASGGNGEDFAVAQYNPNGSLDTTFGSGGQVTTDFSAGDDAANAVVIQPDGKIVVAGFASNVSSTKHFALARYNADGTLDATFGTGGQVTTDFGDSAYAVALQADGRIVAAGVDSSSPTTSDDFGLVRYNSDGSLDTSFGSGGQVTTDLGSYSDQANAVTIQSDGKIIAAGLGGAGFGLARYNTNGSLDASFGTGGKVTTAFNGGSAATSIAIQSDGKIVAAGYVDSGYDRFHYNSNYDFALARYQANGSLDTGFGSKGKVVTDFASFVDKAYGVALQSDGKIVAAGSAYSNTTSEDFALVRYTTSGGLDSTFGSGGKVTTDFSGATQDYGQGVALQSDGKIVVAGSTNDSNEASEYSLARYNPDGTLDTGFGSGGKAVADFSADLSDGGSAVAIQSDGKIIVVGTTYTGVGAADFTILRFTAGGILDTSFGTGGRVTTDFSRRTDHATAVAIQGDGKIVVAGLSYTVGRTGVNDDEFALARYNTDGSLDASFGSRGEVLTSIGSASVAFGVALQGDGKIVVAGRADGSTQDFALARYNTDGSLDTTFGSGGTVTTDFAGGSDQALAVAIQSDGKIVAAGEAYGSTGPTDFALARYTASGTLDTSFGAGGKVTTDFAGSYNRAYSVAIQSDGQIVAAGYAITSPGHADLALARYTSGGSLDTSFGSGGKVTTDFGGNDNEAYGVAIQSDGKIVAAGAATTNSGPNKDFVLARYLGSASALQPLAGAIMSSIGSASTLTGYAGMGLALSSDSSDAGAAFPQGPLGVVPDTAPWVAESSLAARRRHAMGAAGV